MKYLESFLFFVFLFVCVNYNTAFFQFSIRPTFRYPTTYPKINIKPPVFKTNLFHSSVIAESVAEHSLFGSDFNSGFMREGFKTRVAENGVHGESILKNSVPEEPIKIPEDTRAWDGLCVVLALLAILIIFIYLLYKYTFKPLIKVVISKKTKHKDPKVNTTNENENQDSTSL